MNTSSDASPALRPTELTAGHAPPTPPHDDPLNDIYGSEPSSPLPLSQDHHSLHDLSTRAHEILSDLPSRQRTLNTDAYREGLSNSKGRFVQAGFDEGYSLGANLGLQVGYILGVLHGLVASLTKGDDLARKEMRDIFEDAQKELAIEQLLGQAWVDEEGIWKWDVNAGEDEPTFRQIAEQHPAVSKWFEVIGSLAAKWQIDLQAVEKVQVSLNVE